MAQSKSTFKKKISDALVTIAGVYLLLLITPLLFLMDKKFTKDRFLQGVLGEAEMLLWNPPPKKLKGD